MGWELYGLLEIEKGGKARMHAQHGRNYGFFRAPVGLFFTVDRKTRAGSFLDYACSCKAASLRPVLAAWTRVRKSPSPSTTA